MLNPGLNHERHAFHSLPFIDKMLWPPTIGSTVVRLSFGLGRLCFWEMAVVDSGLKVMIAGENAGHMSSKNISVSVNP